MTLSYGTETYTRTMQLTVLSLTKEVVTLTEELGGQPAIFILPGTSPIQVKVQATILFVIDDYLTQGIGTVFDGVELLQLVDFVELKNGTIMVQPLLAEQIGEYPFILRVFDA